MIEFQKKAAFYPSSFTRRSFETIFFKNPSGRAAVVKEKQMTNNVFREYDIRGIVEKEIPLSEIENLTKAITTYFLEQKPNLSKIVIGMDGRTHSPQIKEIVIKTITSLGLDVLDIGLCPTPVFYFSLFNTPITSGFIITASHNPKEYTGMKICLETKSVWGKQIQEIKAIYKSKNFYVNKSLPSGSVKKYDALTDYITWLSSHFSHLKNKNINAIIDCGNGTGGTVFPRLIKEMGWKNVALLYEEIDGTFPNHEADPTNPKNMLAVKDRLKTDKTLTVGLGLDGDSDRMNPMTKQGFLIPGDQLLALFSKKIIKNHPKANIVFDIKSSTALIEALEEIGAIPRIAPSGHSIIKEHLRKYNAKLAGELSCHFFFNDRYFGYDDGIYAALRLFELLDESKQDLESMLNDLPQKVSSPEYRIACEESDKTKIVNHVKTIFGARKETKLLTIDGVRAETSYGWGLIRASNTQPVLCFRFESETEHGLKKLKTDFTKALTPYFSEKILKEHFGE